MAWRMSSGAFCLEMIMELCLVMGSNIRTESIPSLVESCNVPFP